MSHLPDTIPAVNQDARDRGMTYGNWVALHYRQIEQPKPSPAEAGPKKQLPPEEIARRKAFGARLTQARKERWLTQTQLALQMGTQKSVISKWELGLSWPKEQNLRKLRQIFGEELEL